MAKENLQGKIFDEEPSSPGTLSDKEIHDYVNRGFLISKQTFDATSLEGSSYDIRIGSKGVIGGEGIEIDLNKESMELQPGAYGGVVSFEKFKLSNKICARIGSKRALSYDGLILLTGNTVDPGYEGHLLFGIYNASQRKVILRARKKICNVVFERLSVEPERLASADESLISGNFPDKFLDHMVNMDVLPWMQISERVKQIELITKDIIDLKKRYDDVLVPINKLTENVTFLTTDVKSLADQTKMLSKDLDSIGRIVQDNGMQVQQLTANLGILTGQATSIQSRIIGIESTTEKHQSSLTKIGNELSKFKVYAFIIFGVITFIFGMIVTKYWNKLFP